MSAVLIDSKPCKFCGKPIDRVKFKCDSEYNRATLCSRECVHANRRAETLARMPEKICKQCGSPISRQRIRSVGEYAKLQFCGAKCRDLAAIKPMQAEENPCKACGSPINRRKGERLSRWKARKTCSDICASKLMSAGHLQRKHVAPAVVASPRVAAKPIAKPLAVSATMCAYCKKLPVMQGRRYCSPECADSLMRLEEARERLYRTYQPTTGRAAVTCVKCARVATHGKYCSRHGEGK